MRAPRHYLLLVVYLHSSLKEKRETHISLTNSLFFSSSVLSLFIKKSLFCSSLLQLSFLQFFVKKMQIHSSLVQNLQKKFATPIRGQTKKEKRREEPSTDRFFQRRRRRDYTLETLSSKKIIQTQGVFTHTRVHTHTLLSLSICKLSEHCCCCCCCCELCSVFSSSLSLSLS